jgi:hypothetical protein
MVAALHTPFRRRGNGVTTPAGPSRRAAWTSMQMDRVKRFLLLALGIVVLGGVAYLQIMWG